MPGFKDFDAERSGILAAPFTRVSFELRRYMADWLVQTHEKTGNTPTDLLNNAIGLACVRRLALSHGLQLVMRDGDGVYEFPVHVEKVEPLIDDVKSTVQVTQANESYLRWAEQERDLSVGHIAHEGVQMLGALAVVPRAKIVIPEAGRKEQFVLGLGTPLDGAPVLRPNI